MRSLRIVVFRKTRVCPPSEALMLYAERTLGRVKTAAINVHLSECDFCGAETQLLTKHPPSGSPVASCGHQMPVALRHLAEDLMFEARLDLTRLHDSSADSERFTFTDA
jgi:hypothetical protein